MMDNRQKHNLIYHQSKSLECKYPHPEEEKAGVDLLFARQLWLDTHCDELGS